MDDWKLDPAHDLGLPLKERTRSLRREAGLVETILHAAWWAAVRAYLVVYHRLQITGLEHLPVAPPFILVANHASHLDALVLASPLPARIRDRVFPIAAGDTFFETPATAIFAAFILNALPIWRKNCGPHALHELRDRLVHEPCAYILFPEGTRTRDGRMNRFKPGIGMLVAGTNVPVVPCYLAGCFEAWPPRAKVTRPKRIRVRIGSPLSFASASDDRPGWGAIASRIEQAVAALNCNSSQG